GFPFDSTMKWSRRIQIDFQIPDRNKGHKLFNSGAVKIKSGGPGKVTASVNGPDNNIVEIKLNSDAVVAFCNCRRFGDGEFCGHIWGTLLAAESEGHLRRIASMWAPYLVHPLEDPEVLDTLDLAEDGQDSSAFDFTDTGPVSPLPSVAR